MTRIRRGGERLRRVERHQRVPVRDAAVGLARPREGAGAAERSREPVLELEGGVL